MSTESLVSMVCSINEQPLPLLQMAKLKNFRLCRGYVTLQILSSTFAPYQTIGVQPTPTPVSGAAMTARCPAQRLSVLRQCKVKSRTWKLELPLRPNRTDGPICSLHSTCFAGLLEISRNIYSQTPSIPQS